MSLNDEIEYIPNDIYYLMVISVLIINGVFYFLMFNVLISDDFNLMHKLIATLPIYYSIYLVRHLKKVSKSRRRAYGKHRLTLNTSK